MKLSDLTLPLSLEVARGLALVFTPQLAARLAELHAEHGSPNCVPVPRVLADGRLMLCADLLTEVMPGGLLHAMWEAADKEVLLPAVEVVPIEEAVALMPQPQEPLTARAGTHPPSLETQETAHVRNKNGPQGP